MSKIRIVTDSSITIEPELVEKYNITIVPLSVMVDGVIYSDSDLHEEGRFLEMMKNSKELPKTSQPPVGLFAETFEKLIKDGAEQIIAIHLMHTLSGTCEASRQGAILSGADVTVIDSGFIDQCLKFQVVEAAKLAQAGASLEDIVAHVEEVKSKSELHIGVSTLENLVKGGRIGRVTGLLSSLLNNLSQSLLIVHSSSAKGIHIKIGDIILNDMNHIISTNSQSHQFCLFEIPFDILLLLHPFEDLIASVSCDTIVTRSHLPIKI